MMEHFGKQYELYNEEPQRSECEGGDESQKLCQCFYDNYCEDLLYYYLSDHTVSPLSLIGSSTFLTDALGILYETPLPNCQAQRKVNIGVPSGNNNMHSESAKIRKTDEFMLYLPFGEAMAHQKMAGWATPYTFTGKEQDVATGLHYFGARYLDTRLSMWFGVDPLAEKYPGYSPYSYVYNNPLRYIDPTGMEGEDPEDCDGNPTYKLLNFNHWNPQGSATYGSAVVLPMNLNDHNGAMQQRFDEAIKMNLPIIQVENIQGLVDALEKLKANEINIKTFVFVGHGGPGAFKIGDDRVTIGNKSLIDNLSALNGKNCVFTHCNITQHNYPDGEELLMYFANKTKSIAIFNAHLGWGLTNLNGKNNFFSFSKDDGERANDFSISRFGTRVRNIYDVNINFSTGGINYSIKDR